MATPNAFRSMFGTVEIFSPSTGKWKRFDVGAPRSDAPYLPYFQTMTVKRGLSCATDVKVQLSPPTYEEFISLIESEWLRLGNTLKVSWGYVDNPAYQSPAFYSFMMKPDVNIDASFSVTINGTGFDAMMQRSGSKKVWATEDKPIPLVLVIVAILAPYGIPLYVDDVLTTLQNYQSVLGQTYNSPSLALTMKRKSIVQTGINDWAFIRRECERIGYHSTVIGSEMHLVSSSTQQKPKQTYRMFAAPTTDPTTGLLDVWPMSDFQTEYGPFFFQLGQAAYVKPHPDSKAAPVGSVASAVSWALDSPTKQSRSVYSATVKDADFTATAGPSVSAARPADVAVEPSTGLKTIAAIDDDSAGVFVSTASQDEVASLVAGGTVAITAAKTGVAVSFNSIEDPTLDIKDLITLENIGGPFNGNYRVFELETTIGSSFGSVRITARQLGWNSIYEHPERLDATSDENLQDPDPSTSTTDVTPDPSAGK